MLSSFIVRYGYYYELSINLIGHRHNLFHSHLAAFENRLIDNKFNSVNRLIAHSKASPTIMNFKTINSKRRHFLFGVIFFSWQICSVWLRSRFGISSQSLFPVKSRFCLSVESHFEMLIELHQFGSHEIFEYRSSLPLRSFSGTIPSKLIDNN